MKAAPEPGLDILNCGAGHMEVRFEKGDAIELERAKRVITDMLRRGYALFIEGPEGLVRVKSFDPEKCVYIIGDGPLYAGEQEIYAPAADSLSEDIAQPKLKPRRGRPPKNRTVPMEKVRVTAIGRSAGG